MKPAFIGAVGIITRDLAAGRSLYVTSLGLPLEQLGGANFLHTDKLPGSRYFGVWPLSEAAKACFGNSSWPSDRPIPQMFIELEMASPADVARAAAELESKGHRLLHGPRTDPWGQTVARLQTPEGLIVGVSYVPWMHRIARRARRRKRTPRARSPRGAPAAHPTKISAGARFGGSPRPIGRHRSRLWPTSSR